MLINFDELKGYTLDATDGELGSVHDLYFDDHSWMVRYLVVDTGGWLTGRQVLVSPFSLGEPNVDDDRLPVALTCNQIEEGPPIGADRPVSRQQEVELTSYFGWPSYWEPGPTPMVGRESTTAEPDPVSADRPEGDPHLRSVREVEGYHVRARDEEFGHVEDFVVQTDDWSVNLLVIDTRPWWLGKNVVVSPAAIEDVSWDTRQIRVGLTGEEIKSRPEFDIHEQLSTG
jgi:uncharacterized protein YrrD